MESTANAIQAKIADAAIWNTTVTIICACIGAISLCLAAPLFYIHLRNKNANWNIDQKLLAMLILFDIGVSVCLILVMTSSVTTNFQIYLNLQYGWFCQIQVVLLIGFIHSSLYTVALIACERFLLICRQVNVSDWIWWVVLFLMTSITWVLCIITASYGAFQMMPLGGYCFILWNNIWNKVDIVVFGAQGVSSIVLLIFCYLGIIWTRYKSINDLNSFGSSISNCTQLQQEIRRNNRKQARGTLYKSVIQIVLYFLCFLPEVLAFFYEIISQRSRPLIWDAISLIAVSCAALNNCIVILVLYPNYRNELLRFYFVTPKSDENGDKLNC